MRTIAIAGRTLGPGHPCYVIAEMSANHMQDYARAERLVHAAKASGADAIKLQTYTANTITLDVATEPFLLEDGLWMGQTLHQLYASAEMPWEWQPRLKAVADDIGIHLFSSPFDASAVEFLEAMDVPAYKVASFEIVDIPLIRRMAETGKPMLISTGMATLEEIEEAVGAARAAGAQSIALLRCNSGYPAPAGEMHLASIPDLVKKFDVPVGLSDHSLGIEAPIAAVALGANLVEKHFHLGDVAALDSAFSLDPTQFAAMVRSIRTVEQMIGAPHYGASLAEQTSIPYRRSLRAARDIALGEAFTRENVRSVRPAGGLHPRHIDAILGQPARRALRAGDPLTPDDIR